VKNLFYHEIVFIVGRRLILFVYGSCQIEKNYVRFVAKHLKTSR
jgi:hypothetical protein